MGHDSRQGVGQCVLTELRVHGQAQDLAVQLLGNGKVAAAVTGIGIGRLPVQMHRDDGTTSKLPDMAMMNSCRCLCACEPRSEPPGTS